MSETTLLGARLMPEEDLRGATLTLTLRDGRRYEVVGDLAAQGVYLRFAPDGWNRTDPASPRRTYHAVVRFDGIEAVHAPAAPPGWPPAP
jgi:hypothetical protein